MSLAGMTRDRSDRSGTEAALRASEERLRLVFAGANIGLFDWNLVDRSVDYSPRFAALLGCAETELGETIEAFTARLHEADAPRVHAAIEQHLTLRAPLRDLELRLRHESGQTRWFAFSAQAVWNGPLATRMVGSIQDIQQRKLQEERIARLSRLHEMLSGIHAAIVRVHDRPALLAESCRIAVQSGKLAQALAIAVEAPSGLQLIAADYEGASWLPAALVALIARHAHPGERLARGEALVLDASAEELTAELKSELNARGHRAFALLPLRVEGQLDSVLALFSGQPGFFDVQERALLSAVCDNIALALEHSGQRRRLAFLAYYDELTRLPKRDLLCDRLNQLLANDEDAPPELALILVEVSRFRHLNESLGRRAGDALLTQVSERLRAHADPHLTLSRFDAHTFAVLVPRIDDEAEVLATVESVVLPAFHAPFALESGELRVNCRIGIALAPADGDSAERLISGAEAALKQVPATGQRYQFCAPGMTERATEKLALETKLRRAVELGQFVLHYQPKVDLKSGRVVGFEALVRWQDADGRLIQPGTFVPMLEETGLILDLGRWVLQRAAAQIGEWSERGIRPPPVAVNISAIELGQPEFLRTLDDTLRRHPHARGSLDLEITESVLVDDLASNVAKLKSIRERGVSVAIDDFGTGYSSLGYLSRLPVDALKIDRSFVTRMGEDPHDMTIVMAIISLAHSMDLKVIAEGPETPAQAQLLRLLKCDQLQGFCFAKPLPPEEAVALLEQRLQLDSLVP